MTHEPGERDPIFLQEDYAGVSRAVDGAELEALGWLRDLAQPFEHSIDLLTHPTPLAVECANQRVADDVGNYSDFQKRASVTTEIRSPATAAEIPRRVESFSQTLLRNPNLSLSMVMDLLSAPRGDAVKDARCGASTDRICRWDF